MNASELSKDLYIWLETKQRMGKIHSIFESTVNLLSEDNKFIPIVIHNKPMSPFSIRLERNLNLKRLGLSIGQEFIIDKQGLKSGNLIIDFKDIILWDNKICLNFKKDSLENIIAKVYRIKNYIIEKGNKDGIYELMQFIPFDLYKETGHIIDSNEKFIEDRFKKFVNAFINNHEDIIEEYSKKIIGFGPGLTPSMDDFLTGLMYSSLYFTHYFNLDINRIYKINSHIVHNIENKTTRVSEEMLKQASIGQVNEDLRKLIISILSENNSNLEVLLGRVIDFGHSSGTDILCGVYIGSKIVIENYE